jgi:hypothetical protein
LTRTTSLLALLLLEGRAAVAAPILNIGGSVPFYYEIADTAEAGTDTQGPDDATETYTFTPLTTGAASTTAGYSGSAPYLHAGRSALAILSGGRVSEPLPMSFNRNSSPGGKPPDGNSVFVGTSSLRLLDSSLALPSSASASFAYTFSPANPTAAPAGDEQLTQSEAAAPPPQPPANDPAGPAFLRPDAANPNAAPNASPRDPAQAAGRDSHPIELSAITTAVTDIPARGHPKPASTISGAPARNIAEPVAGATVFDTGPPAPARPLSGGPASVGASASAIKAIYQILQGPIGKAEHGDTRLTAEGYEDTGADATCFTVSLPSDGPVPSRDTTVQIPIMVVGTGGGELPSSLTIFTAESAAMEGAGDSLSYFFHHGIAQ